MLRQWQLVNIYYTGQVHASSAPLTAYPPAPAQVAPLWYLAQFTFNLSLAHTSVTSNTVLSSTSSLFTFLLSVWLLAELFTLKKLACIALLIIGEAEPRSQHKLNCPAIASLFIVAWWTVASACRETFRCAGFARPPCFLVAIQHNSWPSCRRQLFTRYATVAEQGQLCTLWPTPSPVGTPQRTRCGETCWCWFRRWCTPAIQSPSR